MEKPILDFCLLPFILTTLNLFVLYNFSCPVFNTCVKNIFKTKVKRHKSTFAYQKKKKEREMMVIMMVMCFFTTSLDGNMKPVNMDFPNMKILIVKKYKYKCSFHNYHHHQSLNREGRWGTTDDFATSFFLSIFPCSPLPSGTCRNPGLSIP